MLLYWATRRQSGLFTLVLAPRTQEPTTAPLKQVRTSYILENICKIYLQYVVKNLISLAYSQKMCSCFVRVIMFATEINIHN